MRRSPQKIHFSWLVGWCSLGLIIGAALVAFLDEGIFAEAFWLVLASAIFLLCSVIRRTWVLPMAFFAGALFGLWLGSDLRQEIKIYESLAGYEVRARGKVSEDPSIGPAGEQRLYLTSVSVNSTTLPGKIWASTEKSDIKRGDIVVLEGKLTDGFGNIPGVIARAKIVSIERPHPGDIARRARDLFAKGLRTGIPEPQVNLGLGYLLGQKTALPSDLEEQIRAVGLTHVVVASGYNLTILVIFVRRILAGVSKYLATLLSGLMVFSFAMVTGFSSSMTRAALVAALGLLVWYYGRKTHPFILLSFAAAATLCLNPSYVWGDLGWYLSFTSFIGVIVFAPLMHAFFWGRDPPSAIRQLAIETTSAQILTTPLILLIFGQFSIYALPANLAVLPLVPLAMLLTFLGGAGSLLLPALADLFCLPAIIVLRYSTDAIRYFASLPNALTEVQFNPALMVVGYICIAAAIILMKRRTSYDFRNDNQTDDI